MDKALVFVHLTCLFALSLDISNELFYVHYDIHDDDNPGSTMIYFSIYIWLFHTISIGAPELGASHWDCV